jgi:hypothetical protein
MVFRLEDSVRQAQNLGPPEAPSRYKSQTTKASARVWASEAPKRDFCGSGLRSATDEEASEWHFTTILVKSTTSVRSISYRE